MRTFDWAARATQAALARAIAEGLRSGLLPEQLPSPGQLRFVT
jgi:formaldehyde-activating enzyme involved in methanogenesis